MFKNIKLYYKILFLIGILILVMSAIVFFSWKTMSVLDKRDHLREAHLHLKSSVETRVDFSRKRDPALIGQFHTEIADLGRLLSESQAGDDALELEKIRIRYIQQVDQYIELMRTRGLDENSGIEGEFRKKIHELEDLIGKYDALHIYLLQARRSEKDFIMRLQKKYVDKVDASIHDLLLATEKQNIGPAEKEEILTTATSYMVSFHAMVNVYDKLQGLETEIIHTETVMEDGIIAILGKKEKTAELLQQSVIGWAVLFIIAGLLFTAIFGRHITRPIIRLEKAAEAVAKGDLTVQVKVKTNDELGQYARAFNKMMSNLRESAAIIRANQEKLNAQNKELEKNYHEIEVQKLQMEKMYDNLVLLSQMGQKITSNLHITSIVRAIYDNIYHLFDISVYAIGVLDERNNRLNFYGANHKGEDISFSSDSLEDDGLLSVWCFKNQREVHIGDYDTEYTHYIPDKESSRNFVNRTSVIFVPISTETKKYGVITIRSDRKNAFTDYHVYMLRNVAIYAAIAFDNAKAYELISSQKEEIAAQNGHLSHLNTELEAQKELIEAERKKSEHLLLNILPEETALELKEKGRATPRHYEAITVMFADFKRVYQNSRNYFTH